MKNVRRLATTVGAISFAVVMGLIGVTAGAYFTTHPSVVVISAKESDGVAVRGGWLDLDVQLVRNRICDPIVDRWLWRMEGDVIHWVSLPITPSPPVPLNRAERYMLSIQVPGAVPSGLWNYKSRTHDNCPSVFNFSSETVRDGQDIPVEIQDPSASSPMQVVTPPGPVTISPLIK